MAILHVNKHGLETWCTMLVPHDREKRRRLLQYHCREQAARTSLLGNSTNSFYVNKSLGAAVFDNQTVWPDSYNRRQPLEHLRCCNTCATDNWEWAYPPHWKTDGSQAEAPLGNARYGQGKGQVTCHRSPVEHSRCYPHHLVLCTRSRISLAKSTW